MTMQSARGKASLASSDFGTLSLLGRVEALGDPLLMESGVVQGTVK